MLSLYSVYADERRGLVAVIFFTAFLATLALSAAFVFWDLGGALQDELREMLGVGRYIILAREGGALTWADVYRAAAAVCSDRAYGVAYRSVKIAYLNGTERWVTAAFIPRWAMAGVAMLEVVASQAVAREGELLYIYLSNRPLLVTVARVLPGQIYIPGLYADIYLDSELADISYFNAIVVEKGSCGGVEELGALFPRALVIDTDVLLASFWGTLLMYLGGAAVVAFSAAAAVAAMSYALATSALREHWRDFAIMRLLGMKRRQLTALAALLFYTPALSGAAAATLLVSSVVTTGVPVDTTGGAVKAAAVVAISSALPLLPVFKKLYSLQPVEALRYE